MEKIKSFFRALKNYLVFQDEIKSSFLLNKKKINQNLLKANIKKDKKKILFDDLLISRIRNCFLDLNLGGGGHWKDIYDNYDLKILIDSLRTDNNLNFHNVLANPHLSNIHFGFTEICKTLLSNYDYTKFYYNKSIYDCLYRICCSLGVEKMPEPYHKLNSNLLSIDELLDKLLNHLNLKTDFPIIFSKQPGLKTKYGIISSPSMQQLYHAIKIYELTKNINNPKILEIGAGIGMSAYHTWNFGIKDITIVDLPLGCINIGFFLSNIIQKENILFNEETINNYKEKNENKIKLISSNRLDLISNKLDLIVNFDSLTEMSKDQAEKYLEFASKKTKFFYSINHEGNSFTVNELFKNSNFEKISRTITWYRQGYVEELYVNKNI